MAWSGSDRRSRLPTNWPVIRARILNRDKWQCQIRTDGCQLKATEVDHIQPGDDHRPANLQAACTRCHAAKSAAEGAAARARIAQSKYRPAQPHPGLMGGGE